MAEHRARSNAPEGNGFVAVLVDFADALRAAGIVFGTGEVLTYCAALGPLDPTDLIDLYWAGATTLISRPEDLPVYHETFQRFFLDAGTPLAELLRLNAELDMASTLQAPAVDGPDEQQPAEEAPLGLRASAVEVLRRKSFAACTEREPAALRAIMATIRLTPPRRRTRRTRPASAGRTPDLRRTIRESLRTNGELLELYPAHPGHLGRRRRLGRLRGRRHLVENYVGGRPLLLSTAEDGTALAQPRLVTDGDVEGGRYVSGVVVLQIG
ncbi:MAG TPA: hypothetical protein VHX38_01730 [Pseudonocardiaceae bacterium]|jgi:hypothetical protein|nr:hypothetical protein [Pseudonocardiaceae bacterium]